MVKQRQLVKVRGLGVRTIREAPLSRMRMSKPVLYRWLNRRATIVTRRAWLALPVAKRGRLQVWPA